MLQLWRIVLTFLVISLSACSDHNQHKNTITVGTIAGPESKLIRVAAEVAKQRYGLTIKDVSFTDYVAPNIALNDGSIDANIFQHQPYLEETIKARGFKLVAIGKTFIYPMAIYSTRLKNLTGIKTGAYVAIPNDPSNEARALLLLEKAGLIQLQPGIGAQATVKNIVANPYKLQIKELDAAQLPRLLSDVDLAVINTNYAIAAKLLPTRDGLFVENSDSSLYGNIIVVRENDADNPKFQQLIEAMHSKEVIEKAESLFEGQAIPAWR